MKSTFVYTRYQSYGLSQAIPTLPHPYCLLQAIQHGWTGIRTTACWPAKCKVCTTRQAQSHTPASLSLVIHYTEQNTHTGHQTFKKGVVVDSLALKNIDIFSKTANRKNFRPNDLQKTANSKIVRPTNLKYGQISEIWPQNGQSGNPGLTDKLSVLSEPRHARRIRSYYLVAETSSVSSVFIARGYLRSNVQDQHPFHHLPQARGCGAGLYEEAVTGYYKALLMRKRLVTVTSRQWRNC